MGIFSRFWPFWPFWPNLALFLNPGESRRGGFYINPSRRGPAVSKRGVPGGLAGKGPKRAFSALFGQKPRKSGFSGSLAREGSQTVPGEPRGPGARGWCKTPLAGPAGTGIPGSGEPPGHQDPVRGPRDLPEAPPGPSRGPGSPLRASRSEGFTSTPRAGAPRFPGVPLPGSRDTLLRRRGKGWCPSPWFVGAEGATDVDRRGLARRAVRGREYAHAKVVFTLLL